MEDFIKGSLMGIAAGMIIGGIVVAKNKKLASKIRDGLNKAEDKIQEVKEDLQEKMEENDCIFASNNKNEPCDCDMPGCDCYTPDEKREPNKKLKK